MRHCSSSVVESHTRLVSACRGNMNGFGGGRGGGSLGGGGNVVRGPSNNNIRFYILPSGFLK